MSSIYKRDHESGHLKECDGYRRERYMARSMKLAYVLYVLYVLICHVRVGCQAILSRLKQQVICYYAAVAVICVPDSSWDGVTASVASAVELAWPFALRLPRAFRMDDMKPPVEAFAADVVSWLLV